MTVTYHGHEVIEKILSLNEMDRVDCPYGRNTLGRIYKSALTVQGCFFNSPTCNLYAAL